jgi:hypothetical protein
MFKTLKGGVNKITTQIKKLTKKITKIYKKNAKKLVTLSVISKLVFLSMPAVVLPAYAQETSVVNNTSVNLELSKNDAIFVTSKNFNIKIGQSNNDIAKTKNATKAVAATPVVKNTPALSLEQLRTLYQEVQSFYGIDGLAEAIESVHQLETGKSNSTSVSSGSGAVGPMQFLPSTFRSYCKDTGAGCNITDLRSSVYAAGNLLSKSYIWKGSWQGAFLNYNHSIAYANKAVALMNGI